MTSIPRLLIASYERAEEFLRSPVAADITHVVSINDPDTRPPSALEGHRRRHRGRHLVLHFHDVSSVDRHLTTPTRDHVKQILKFAEQCGDQHNVLVHCAAGISRSSAAALAIIASKLKPSSRSAHEAVRIVMAVKQTIYPNRLMVALADDLLGYRGALTAAHGATFRGGEIFIPGLDEADAFFEENEEEDPLDP